MFKEYLSNTLEILLFLLVFLVWAVVASVGLFLVSLLFIRPETVGMGDLPVAMGFSAVMGICAAVPLTFVTDILVAKYRRRSAV